MVQLIGRSLLKHRIIVAVLLLKRQLPEFYGNRNMVYESRSITRVRKAKDLRAVLAMWINDQEGVDKHVKVKVSFTRLSEVLRRSSSKVTSKEKKPIRLKGWDKDTRLLLLVVNLPTKTRFYTKKVHLVRC